MSRSEILKKYPAIATLQREYQIRSGIWQHYRPATLDQFKHYCDTASVTQARINSIRRQLYLEIVENGDLLLLRSGAIREVLLTA